MLYAPNHAKSPANGGIARCVAFSCTRFGSSVPVNSVLHAKRHVSAERETFRDGDYITTAIPDAEIMKHCVPRYQEFRGWQGPIRGIKEYADLPTELQEAITILESLTNVNVRIISVGPDREETIFL